MLLINLGADPCLASDVGQLPIDLAHKTGKGNRVAYLKTVGPKMMSQKNK